MSTVTNFGVPVALPYDDVLVKSPLSKFILISSPLSGTVGAAVGSGVGVGAANSLLYDITSASKLSYETTLPLAPFYEPVNSSDLTLIGVLIVPV